MNFKEYVNENETLSSKFSKFTGLKKDMKNIGKGDVYKLKDGSSIVIGNEKNRIQYYDRDMNYITSYKRVPEAIKALGQMGIL